MIKIIFHRPCGRQYRRDIWGCLGQCNGLLAGLLGGLWLVRLLIVDDYGDVTAVISSGVVFKLNTIWPTKITTHRFYYYFNEPFV